MGTKVVGVLKAVIAVALAGSLFVQGVMVPLIWIDMEDARNDLRIPFVVIVVFGIVCLQVIGVCVWRLLSLVRRGTVFSHASFRYVDLVIGAIGTGSLLVLGLAVLAAYANRTSSGDEVAPGLVGLVCGLALVVAGFALLVLVLRNLLAQAVDLDSRAQRLQSELDEVI